VAISKELTRLEHSGVRLAVTIGKEDLRTQYDEMVSEYCKTLQIRGFRKGKVPRAVLENKFGPTLKDDALSRILEKAISDLFGEESPLSNDERPLPYSTPKLEGQPALDFDADLKIAFTYDVFPQVKVDQWKGFQCEVPQVEITDEDLNRELEQIRERNAIVEDKEEGEGAAEGDILTVDYCELSEAGEPVEGTERKGFAFTLGTTPMFYRFEEEVKGLKKGETREFEKQYPPDFPESELAGQTKKLRVTLLGLKRKELPALDDDLAQDVDEKFHTLDDLKASIRERLSGDLGRRLDELKLSSALEKIIAANPVDIPESMIQVELDSRWRNLARQFGLEEDQLERVMGAAAQGPGEERQTRAGLFETWRPATVKALHSRLIVEKLIESLKIEVSDTEVDAEVAKLLKNTPGSEEDARAYYERKDVRAQLTDSLKDRKMFDMIRAENVFKAGPHKTYLELEGQKE